MEKLSKELKELCLSKNLSFEYQHEVQDYLRNEKYLHVDIYFGSKSFKWEINNWIIDLKHKKKIKWPTSNKLYDSYEDALSICLIEMLKLI